MSDRQPRRGSVYGRTRVDPRTVAGRTAAAAPGCAASRPAFAKSSDFAIDKPAGTPCPNLAERLPLRHPRAARASGASPAASVFDCFGAGQQVTQETFGGRRLAGDARHRRADVRGAAGHAAAARTALVPDRGARSWTRRGGCTRSCAPRSTRPTGSPGGTPEELLALDVDAYRRRVNPLLQQASELARAGSGGRRPDHRGANLIGRRLRGRRPARREPARGPADRRRPARRRPAVGPTSPAPTCAGPTCAAPT